MPDLFVQTKFLGATVVSYAATGGWGQNVMQVSIMLVEDKNVGDDFILKEENVQNINGQLIGTPVTFQVSGFRFDGLILTYSQKDSFQGHPTFEVILTGATSLLEGTHVILSDYVGPTNDSIFSGTPQNSKTFAVSNILNVYGYLEQGGAAFGNSQENESGLLWEGVNGVKNAIMSLSATDPTKISTDQVHYGSYITYRGHYYKVDLSGLPIAPGFYRVGGNTFQSLIEIINQVCDDGGVTYMVQLTLGQGNGPHTISFIFVNNVLPGSIGTLGAYIAGQTNINESSYGQELRNDTTQAFIVGGKINLLQTIQNTNANFPMIVPFFGFDVNGNPITGQKPDGTYTADDDLAFSLNASRIIDIMGSLNLGPSYSTNILELRCALIDYDSWAAYLAVYKPQFAKALGLYGAVKFTNQGLVQQLVSDFVDDSITTAQQMGLMNQNTQWTSVSQRVYDFVRDQAETYYGKMFLVKLPFKVSLKIIPETTSIQYSHEPTDAGYLAEGSSPLGLNYVNESFFLDQTGRFYPFLQFQYNSPFKSVGTINGYANGTLNSDTKILTANPSLLDTSAVVQPNNDPSANFIYVKNYSVENGPTIQNGLPSIGGQIIFVPNPDGVSTTPAMVISIASPIWAIATDPLGGVDDIGAILNVSSSNLFYATQFRADSWGLRVHPAAFYPIGVALAIQSNQFTYGPWGKFNKDGKAYVEFDETLVPWEYGGYGTLTQAAIAKLHNIATGNQVQERGSVTIAGLPTASLGQTLDAGSAVINRIDVNIGTQGVTTTYTMETFVPRYGVFIRENVERLKRFGRTYQQLRRAIRQLYLERNAAQQVINSYYNGFMNGTSYAVRQQTPHAVIGAHVVNFGSGVYGTLAYAETFRESVANVQAQQDSLYQSSAAMSMEGLFRPFSTDTRSTSMSHFSNNQLSIPSTAVYQSKLNPFQNGSDFNWFSNGNTYNGLNNRQNPGDVTTARGVGLRGPIVMAGWGYDLAGSPVPNISASGFDTLQKYSSTTFANGYLKNPTLWPAGPVDLRWDKFRGVWTIPTMLIGQMSGVPLNPGGSGPMQIMLQNGTVLGDTITVWNAFRGSNATIATGVWMQAIYYPLDGKYLASAADCP